jgi:hypothetical protein
VDCIHGGGINFSHSLKTAIPRNNLKVNNFTLLSSATSCDVYMCRWNDNSVVTLALNHQTHLPMETAKRCPQHNKKRIDVPEASIIRSYKKGMG